MKEPVVDPIAFFEQERMAAKPYDSSDEQSVNNARKAAALRESNRLDTMKTMMMYPNGREVIFDMVKCAIVGNPFRPESMEATCYNLGLEAKARQILYDIIKAAPAEFLEMIQECEDKL